VSVARDTNGSQDTLRLRRVTARALFTLRRYAIARASARFDITRVTAVVDIIIADMLIATALLLYGYYDADRMRALFMPPHTSRSR